MVPKFNSESSLIQTSMDNDELEDSTSDDSDEGGSVDFDGAEDFLEQLKESSKYKRKIDQIEGDADANTERNENKSEEQAPSKKKRKKKKSADMKPPTAEEMIRLRETENLFHSNLFRMQIEEMIKEVRPKKSERKQMKPWLESVEKLFLNMEVSNKSELNIDSMPAEVKYPLPTLSKQPKGKTTTFLKPEDVSVTGSYSAGCSLGPSLNIDVVVTIPKKCFLKEDYLNTRYHQKRAVYLSHLASELSRSNLVDSQSGISWTLQGCSCALSPRLVLHPSDKLSSVTVYVSAVPATNTFKLSRFTPAKNNIRESWLMGGTVEDCSTPTPIYNTSIMRDLVSTANENVRLQTLENHNHLKDAISLLRVWLKQRQLDQGAGGFSGYLISMLVVALFTSRKLNALMSSYQIIRNVWLFLDQSDWTKEGFSMCSTKKEDNTPTLEEFHRHFDVVFVDITGYCNLAASIHRLTYLRVKQEAKLAVECLDNPNKNSFQALFMTSMPFLRQFDYTICIKKPKQLVKSVLAKESSLAERTNHFATEDLLFTDIVTKLLMKGMGGRVETLTQQLTVAKQWLITQKPSTTEKTLVLGLRLNVETAFSVVEKGPPANESEAAEFRALWGKRCELRRFRDGSVCEAVVWAKAGSPLSTRRLISQQMCQCLLSDRLGLPKYTISYLANQLEPLITEKEFLPDGFELGTGEEAGNAAVQVFDRLAKQLRELPDLPLEVAGVQGVSAVLRGAEVFPPLACLGKPKTKAGIKGPTSWLLSESISKAPDYIPAVKGVLQLGLSRKWPEDPEAVRRVRAAFNLHIAKAMLEKYDVQTQAHADFVDIFKEGFVFRIRISYPREVALLKESKTPDGVLCYRDTPESLELEKETIHLPKLTGALHGLQQQFPAASVVFRLAKRWLNSQLLDASHVPDLATELLVASLFLSPEPFRALAQPQPMFLRFLHLLASHDWHLEPVVVNFNDDLKREDLIEIESTFRNERATLPPMVICTQYDKSGSVWTRDAPLLPVLVRLANLAKQSLNILESNLLEFALLEECKVVFRPPLDLYDVLIRLKPVLLPRFAQGVDYQKGSQLQLRAPEQRSKIPITGFDPAQCYLQELRAGYNDYALFFHDTYGGSVIGVLFKPTAFEKREFKVSHINCRKPIKEENAQKTTLSLNFNAIIEDFYILGAGLVKTIDLSPKYCSKVET